jgi:tetratricopeptide (TPR) repeat protein
MKGFIILILLVFNLSSIAQDFESITDNFRADSAQFRDLQRKRILSNQLSVYEWGYSGQPGKKLTSFSQIKSYGSYIWIMRSNDSRVKLLVAVEQNSSEEWGTTITVLNFDKNEQLRYIRNDKNHFGNVANADKSQLWITDGGAQPCNFFFMDGRITVNDLYCSINDVLNEYYEGKIMLNGGVSDTDVASLLQSFGIYNKVSVCNSFDKSAYDFAKSNLIDGRDFRFYFNQAWEFVKRNGEKDYDAIVHFEAAIKANPTFGGTFSDLANCYRGGFKCYEQAERYYTKAIENGFNKGFVYYNRAICRFELKNLLGMRSDLNQAKALGWNNDYYKLSGK